MYPEQRSWEPQNDGTEGLREAPASTHSAAATAEEATFLRSDAVSHVITGYHLGTLVGRDPLRQRPAVLQRLLW